MPQSKKNFLKIEALENDFLKIFHILKILTTNNRDFSNKIPGKIGMCK